jgi:hypothetical protein
MLYVDLLRSMKKYTFSCGQVTDCKPDEQDSILNKFLNFLVPFGMIHWVIVLYTRRQ